VPAVLTSERDRAVLRSFAQRIDPGDAGAHNNLGVLYFNKGMTAEAVAEFTRALELDPRMTIAQRNLEIAYFNSGYYDARVQALTDRLGQVPGDREARWELGRTYALLGDTRQAADCFGALLREDPDDVDAMLHLAKAEAAAGDPEHAARWLQHAVERAPDRAALHLELGQTAYHRGLNEDARRHLQRAVELSPDDADAWYLLGFVMGDMGDHEAARDATTRAMRLNPSLGKAHANLSLERFDRRSWERVREAREARGLPDAMTVAEDGTLAHFNLGLACRQKGYLAEALREYQLALDRGEDRTLVLQAMAEVHLLRRESQAAVQLYDRLLQLNPHAPKLWNERGIALHQDGRHAEAASCYARAVEADGQYVLALNNLGVAHFHAGRRDLAFDAFRRALQEEPGFIKGRLNLALLLFRQREYQRCLAAYRQVLRLSPEHAVAWNGVGLVLAQMRKFEDARNAFARAVDARPEYAEAHYNLSFALSNLGDFAGSLRETKRALELDPFYTPQKFELAVDLEYEDPRLEVAPDLGEERRDAVIGDFAFEPAALDQLFQELAPVATSSAASRGGAPFAAGLTMAAKGDLEGAVMELRRAMAGGAPRDQGLVALGDAFLSLGLAGEALERYREARALAPGLVPAAMGEVRALVVLRRHAEAISLAEWLAATCGEDVDALLLAAAVFGEQEDADRAHALLASARQLAPMRADVLQAIGQLAHATGDDLRAIESYRHAIALDEDFAACRVQLAERLRVAGLLDDAEHELEAALASVPTYADAVLALAALRRETGQAPRTIELLATFLGHEPYHLEALASLGESLYLAGRCDDARFALDRVLRFDRDHVAALFFDGVLLAEEHRFHEAIARWQRVDELEPASPYARRARREMRTAQDLQRIFVGRARAEHHGGRNGD
jgi:cellulose synthase operon protein C